MIIIDKILKLKKTHIGYLASHRHCFSTRFSSHEFGTPKLSVVFFGTDLFSIKILTGLNKLYKDKIIKKINVVTSATPLALRNKSIINKSQSDLTNFRGDQIIQYCIRNDIDYYNWNEIKNNKEYEKRLSGFQVGVVASFGHLIPSSLIDSFP